MLDASVLARSIVQAGSAAAWEPVFDRLDAGDPITIGVFGASVAQNGGCTDQPYKRCMRYDGVHSTFMRWGTPRIRPFKGYVVRMLEHVNRSYPHRRHQINNSALDATPAQNALPCLFSHLPTTLHVVILEFGSMAFHLHHAAVEGAARMLLSLNPRPLLIFLSMSEWCQRLKDKPRSLYETGERLRGGYVYPDTPWSRAEAEATRVCDQYGQMCLSVHRALEPEVRARKPGFALTDVVGDDCLHPTQGVHGAEYISEILANAFDTARATHSRRAAPGARNTPRAPAQLPPPLHAENAQIGDRASRCYGFVKAADYRKTYGQSSMYRALQPIEWVSAWCAAPGEWMRPAAASGGDDVAAFGSFAAGGKHGGGGRRELGSDDGAGASAGGRFRFPSARQVGSSGGAACAVPPRPAVCPRAGFGPSARAAQVLRRFLRSPPQTWFWCYSSLAMSVAHQKKSPGVLALTVGATLHFPIDARMPRLGVGGAGGASGGGAAATAIARNASRLTVHIEHLTSYEGMGVAAIRCVGGCTCPTQRVDAHKTDAHRNVSVFLQHSFELAAGLGGECALQLQILPDTSSGAHKFKVRTVTLSSA